jgi:predicted amino acid racemase
MIEQCGFRIIADSREENLASLDTGAEKMLLRIGMPDRADQTVQAADISLQSEIGTIKALDEAAGKSGKVHKVILMIDLGDLREGLFYKDRELILETAAYIVNAPNLELLGTGTNLTCYGSVVPTRKNLNQLVSITRFLEKELRISIPYVAGGNSSSLYLVKEGRIPAGINMLRIGEAILLGTDTSTGQKFPELCDDAFILEAELVEVQIKPSKPIGKRSVDFLGNRKRYKDSGDMRRGILAVGRQDVLSDGLIPTDERIRIVGESSDHLIIDLNSVPSLKVGDTVRFKLGYGGLLDCYTSRYVSREYL